MNILATFFCFGSIRSRLGGSTRAPVTKGGEGSLPASGLGVGQVAGEGAVRLLGEGGFVQTSKESTRKLHQIKLCK